MTKKSNTGPKGKSKTLTGNPRKSNRTKLYSASPSAGSVKTPESEALNGIKKSEERFRMLLENSRDVIFHFDIKKGEYVYVSPSSKEILGIEPNEFIVQKYGVLVSRLHKDDRKRIDKHFREIFTLKGKKKKSFFIEYRFLFNKSEYKWIADNHTVVYDSHGKPESLVGNISDVTFRKEAQEQLVTSYELQKGYLDLLSSLQNALPAHIAMLDKKGNIVTVNESWRKYSGKNGLIHNNISVENNYIRVCSLSKGRYAPEAKHAARGIRMILNGKTKEFSVEYPCREFRWYRLVVTPINRYKNEGAVVMHIDITQRKQAEHSLKLSEEQYRLLFYDNPLPMWVFDSDSLKIIAVNDESILRYGFSKSEFLKMKVTDLIHPDEKNRYIEFRKRTGNANTRFNSRSRNVGIWKHVTKKGGVIDVEVTRRPVLYKGKNAVLVLAKDITERVNALKSLKKRNQEISLLYKAEKELTSSLDPSKIYGKIFGIVSKILPCSSMVISSFDRDKNTISCIAAWLEGKKLESSFFPVLNFDKKGKGIQSRTIISGRSSLIPDFERATSGNKNNYYIYESGKVKRTPGKSSPVKRSLLVVPMKFGNRVIGLIQVSGSVDKSYTENDLKILEALSAQLSAATANAQLYQQAQSEIAEREKAQKTLRTRSEELVLLYESSKELSNTLEIDSIYERIYRIVSLLMPCSGMGISSFDEKDKLITAQVIWQNGMKHDTSGIPPIKFDDKGKGLQSRVIKTRKSVFINDYDKFLLKRKTVYFIKDDNSISKKRDNKFQVAKSALLVPLITEGKVIGVIQILSELNNAYSEDNSRILEALSSQAAAAMTNARLFQRAQSEIAEKEKVQEELKRKTGELSVLYEAQKKISNTLDPNIVFDNIYKSVSAIMPCDSMIISSFKKEEKMIKVLAIWADGVKPSIKEYPELPLAPEGFGIQSQVIRSGESRLILDYEEQFKLSKNNYSYNDDEISGKAKSLYSSALLVPMKLEGNVIGTLQVLSYKKNAFNGDNLRMLESLTAPITAATVNAGLYQQSQTELAEKQKAEEALSKKNEEIMILYEAERELSGSLDIENIYDVLYRNISKIISCGSMIISGYDINTNEITCKAAWVEKTKHDPKKFPVLKLTGDLGGTQGEAIRTKKSLIVNNFYEIVRKSKEKFYIDESGNVLDYNNENDQIDEEAPVTKSAMFVPMMLGEKVIGVISVFSFEENAYSDYHLRMLESLSTQVAAVTANAELYARAQNEIDERIKKEIELKEIRRNMEEAQRISHIGNWVLNTKTNEIYNSAEIYNILGLDVITNNVPFGQLLNSIHDEDRDLTHKLINKAILEKKSYINEDRIVKPDGEIRFVRIMGEPVIDENGNLTAMQGTMQDITDLKRINDELVKSLSEKELMLKEIHHRVKNNLQVVSSLLRLQSEKIKDKATVEYFKLSEQRVKSMALIHQQLYKTKDLSMINFRDYLQELCSYLFFMNGISANTIKLSIRVEDIYFGIDTALPCGLIINELVTNSIKHAFPGGRKGSISISLLENKETGNELIVKDDGIGAGKLDFKNSTTLGMELVDTLTEQLDGRLEVNTDSGTEIRIIFKELYYKKRL